MKKLLCKLGFHKWLITDWIPVFLNKEQTLESYGPPTKRVCTRCGKKQENKPASPLKALAIHHWRWQNVK